VAPTEEKDGEVILLPLTMTGEIAWLLGEVTEDGVDCAALVGGCGDISVRALNPSSNNERYCPSSAPMLPLDLEFGVEWLGESGMLSADAIAC